MARLPADGWSEAANRLICSGAVNRKGAEMFVRAVWRLRRLVDIKQTLREMDVPTTRDAFGLSGQEFQKMTRSLFDRQR
jgi:hypothetical protein